MSQKRAASNLSPLIFVSLLFLLAFFLRLNRLGVPSNRDLAELTARIEGLESLLAKASASGAGGATGKASAKTTTKASAKAEAQPAKLARRAAAKSAPKRA